MVASTTKPLDRRSFLTATAATAVLPLLCRSKAARGQGLVKLKAVYPTRSTSSWPIWMAKEAGIYEKYGMEVAAEFGVHPVGIAGLISGEVHFSNYALDDVAAAAVRDPSLVMMSSVLHKASFALMAGPAFSTVASLKGKRMAVGRVGDPPYNFTVGLLRDYGMSPTDVQWLPTGTDANARMTMLVSGQADAALLTAPSWFRLESQGMKPLTLIEDHDSIVTCTGYTFKKSWATANPALVERIVRAHAEAVHRFYGDKATAIAVYRKYDPSANEADVVRMYDGISAKLILDRVPLVQRAAAVSTAERVGGEVPAAKTLDFQQSIDMRIVRRLITEGFFEKLYGPAIKEEQERKLQATFA